MSAGLLAISNYTPARDRQGRLVAGARMDVYANRTTTRVSVYADYALTTPLTNPVIANSSGVLPAVWADGGTLEDPILYTLAYSGSNGSSIGNPSTFDDVQPSVSIDVTDGASKADYDLGNVSQADYAGKVFPVPIGASGAGMVPTDLQGRFKHFANAVTDFGVSLFESDGVTIKDNQAELQAAMDAIQPYNGALFLPPQDGADGRSRATFYVTSGLVLRDTGGVAGLGMAIEGIGISEPTRGLNGRGLDRGVGLKLADGANAPIILSQPNAGHIFLTNLALNGNSAGQATDQHGIHFEDRLSGYGFGAHISNVAIQDCGRSGLFAGAARGLSRAQWLSVEYCGNAMDSALFLGAFDWILYDLAVGGNTGDGIVIGAAAQVQIMNGATYLNGGTGIRFAPECLSVDIVSHRIESNAGGGLLTQAYTGGGPLLPVRRISSCFFNDNGLAANNVWSDVLVGVGDTALQLVAPAFTGAAGANKVKYNVEFADAAGRAQIIGSRYAASSYVTAYSNAPGQITS